MKSKSLLQLALGVLVSGVFSACTTTTVETVAPDGTKTKTTTHGTDSTAAAAAASAATQAWLNSRVNSDK